MNEALAKNYSRQTEVVAAPSQVDVSSSLTTTEEWMNENVMRVAKRLIPIEDLALVEAYTPSSDSTITSERDFGARLVLLDRISVLTEGTPEDIAQACNFVFIPSERVGLNTAVHFRVEAFSPAESFKPSRSYQIRLIWRDYRGLDQSKLMATPPMELLAIVRSVPATGPKAGRKPSRPSLKRKTIRRANTQG